jgi:hypothetical protein
MNEQNLIPTTKRTKSEAREIGKKGGKASGKARRDKRTFREALELALSIGNVKSDIVGAQIEKALKGDTKAFEVIRDTVGEKPKDKIDMNLGGAFSESVNSKISNILDECKK